MSELTHVSLFSGIGGIDLAAEWAGFRTVLFCENDAYCQKVLRKHWPEVPVHKDIFDLSAWELGDNDGICYNKLCEAKNKEQQILQIYNWLMMPRGRGELIKSVSIAAKWCPYLQALLPEVGNTVLGNVVSRRCEEVTGQMLMVGLGCEETETPTGKMGVDTNGTSDIKKQKYPNGEEGYLPEMITLASNADLNQDGTTIYERTISAPGQNIPKNDLTYLMELLYAKYATTKCTRKANRLTLLTAGVPCQPASVAGKRRGTKDDRWLWSEAIRILREMQPTYAIFENPTGILSVQGGLPLDGVLSDLEGAGYETQAFVIPACAVNAPHRRDRVFIVANAHSRRCRSMWVSRGVAEVPGEQADIAMQIAESGQDVGHASSSGLQGFNGWRARQKPENRCEDVAHTDRADESPGYEQAKSAQEWRGRPGKQDSEGSEALADTTGRGKQPGSSQCDVRRLQDKGLRKGWNPDHWAVEPRLGDCHDGLSSWLVGHRERWAAGSWEDGIPRVAAGVKDRVNKLRALGNAVVPQQCYNILKAIALIEEGKVDENHMSE